MKSHNRCTSCEQCHPILARHIHAALCGSIARSHLLAWGEMERIGTAHSQDLWATLDLLRLFSLLPFLPRFEEGWNLSSECWKGSGVKSTAHYPAVVECIRVPLAIPEKIHVVFFRLSSGNKFVAFTYVDRHPVEEAVSNILSFHLSLSLGVYCEATRRLDRRIPTHQILDRWIL